MNTPPTALHRCTATRMAELLEAGEVSSVELVDAHLDRIDRFDSRVRAFVQVFHAQARAAAAKRDDERRRGEILGPLHGIPISIKESIFFRGHPSTLGLRKRADHRAEEDAVLVRMAREAGAIVLGRTNVPQTLLSFESRNPVYGQTANPFSLAHCPGGSSGGEAAALASGMTPLGLGTDIGGSIRIPAHCCGVTALKPSLDRWSNQGLGTILVGQEAVRAQASPIARSVRDLWFWFRALQPERMSRLDPRVPPVRWRTPQLSDLRGLRVGYYLHDGVLTPSKAIVRAVERAAIILGEAGVEVVPFAVPHNADIIFDYYSAVGADGGVTFQQALRGEEIDVSVKSLARLVPLPNAARDVLSRVMSLRGEKRVARMLGALRRIPVEELWKLTGRLREHRQRLLAAMDDACVDLLVAPPLATPAVPHGLSADFTLAASYTMLWNALQFPAGIVPVTRVRSGEQTRGPGEDRLDERAAEVDRSSVGLPIGVQVIARPWQDELALWAMEVIEQSAREEPDFPATPVEPP